MKSHNRYTNFSLRPAIIDTVSNSVQLGDLLYKAYWNLVFDLTYNKVLHGKYYWMKQINIKTLCKRIVLWYFEISLLMLKLLNHIFKISKSSPVEYLFSILAHPSDHRLIVRIDNKWSVNNGRKKFLANIQNLFAHKQFSHNQMMEINNKFAGIHDMAQQMNRKKIAYLGLFADKKKPQILHKTFLGMTKVDEEVGYETDYGSASSHKFYNCLQLINKFDGSKKESTLLQMKANEMQQMRPEKPYDISNMLTGAVKNGYRQDLLGDEFNLAATQWKEIIEKVDDVFTLIGIDASDRPSLTQIVTSDLVNTLDP